MTAANGNDQFEKLADRLIGEHWDFYPTAGARIGRHEYDGRLPDLSPGRTSRRALELRDGLAALSSLDSDGSGPGPDERLSYRMMELFLKRNCSRSQNSVPWRTIPCGRPGS